MFARMALRGLGAAVIGFAIAAHSAEIEALIAKGNDSGAALAVTSGVLFRTSRPASTDSAMHAHLVCATTLNGLACRTRV
jgi:hypothetical protein